MFTRFDTVTSFDDAPPTVIPSASVMVTSAVVDVAFRRIWIRTSAADKFTGTESLKMENVFTHVFPFVSLILYVAGKKLPAMSLIRCYRKLLPDGLDDVDDSRH